MPAQEAAKSMIWMRPVPLFGLAVDSRLAAIDQNNLFWSLISTKLQCNKYQTGDQNKLFWLKGIILSRCKKYCFMQRRGGCWIVFGLR